ncbi:LysR family transcriptional regulator [Panacagrimonas perspica]|uniref:LysR family transcriptional regulator n=1 Tax=Panacagrimonas perspica TaxID=381431 RepID=A0A4R7PFL0_9GAMM|nr:LysR family transcriptional regulator [Panacagrimonas perspica]TDU32479.1 LysR family transcriptional regulator [Panacagrimonas perspica]THD05393.1 LysR family transcriptional regulator [Panacagrimonas perspica]
MSSMQQYLAFAQTARHGSFAAAARDLGTVPSALAKAVRRLERGLGVALFHRTTRQVRLTPDGERLFRRCERILGEIEALQAEASGAREALVGTLRIDAPVAYGQQVILPRLAQLQRTHPALGLDLRLNDAQIDLLRDGVDLAVRIGELKDSTLVARRIDWQGLVLCAAPAYLAERGTPRRLRDLDAHIAVAFRMPGSGRDRAWQFRQRGGIVTVAPPARTHVNETGGLLEAARLGLGLCQMPDYVAAASLARGELVELMAGLRPPPLPISLVYPGGRLIPARVRAAIEVLAQPT